MEADNSQQILPSDAREVPSVDAPNAIDEYILQDLSGEEMEADVSEQPVPSDADRAAIEIPVLQSPPVASPPPPPPPAPAPPAAPAVIYQGRSAIDDPRMTVYHPGMTFMEDNTQHVPSIIRGIRVKQPEKPEELKPKERLFEVILEPNGECDYCHRRGSNVLPLHLEQLPQNYSRRKFFGDSRNVHQGSSVCRQCCGFLTVQCNFKFAFTAVFYSLFTNPNYTVLGSKLLELLPLEYKMLWQHIDRLTVPRNLFAEEGRLRDVTLRRTHFFEQIGMYQAAALVNVVTKECFPDVRCGLGCVMHIEDGIEKPFHHVLNLLDVNFQHFNANRKHLVGNRPQWPEVKEVLIWRLKSSIIFSEKYGLALLECPEHAGLSLIHI